MSSGNNERKPIVFIIVILFIVLVAIGVIYSLYMNAEITVPYGAIDCIGRNKDELKREFMSAQFTNVHEEILEDLEISDINESGKVESVSINGVTDFSINEGFKRSSHVIIRFHSAKRIGVPLSSEQVENINVETIADAFKAAGFMNVNIGERYDLDPDLTETEQEILVYIDGQSSFSQGSEFPLDSNVEIITHKPYEKYSLVVDVDFVPNLIFSKYDVELKVGSYSKTLSHGTDGKFEYRLKEGKYIIEFISKESHSIRNTAEIDLTGDTVAAYQISCYRDRISVKTQFVEKKSAVGESEAMVPCSASSCKYKNYKDIEATFRSAGFNNIRTEILYDIIIGWTDEGEVKTVSIDGNTEFIRGDVFAKDAEIVITYHMKEEDDPKRKQTPVPSKKEEKRVNLTIENSEDFASIMRITDQTDTATIRRFAYAHKGDIIEFDGCIAFMMNHKDYKTRFDVSIVGNDYYADRVYGPLFAFEDVNFSDMNVSGSDTVAARMNFRIIAEIVGFSEDGGYIILEPISLKAR